MTGTPESRQDRHRRAMAALEEYIEKVEEGTAPSHEQFLEEYDDLRPILEGLLAAHMWPRVKDHPSVQSAPAAIRKFDDYRLLREIGKGGMGVVYEAEQQSLGRRVALKVLPGHSSLHPRAVERFQREAALAGRLEHPGIVPVHAVGESEGVHYFAMEFIQGAPLDKVLGKLGDHSLTRIAGQDILEAVCEFTLRPETAKVPDETGSWLAEATHVEAVCRLVAQLADALQAAHEAGVIHRDIKPGNILVRPDGSTVITDFGLARETSGPSLTRTGEGAGTPYYASPEQLRARRLEVDHRTDVYSLGVTLYELATLQRPFEGNTADEVLKRILHHPPRHPRRLNRHLPRDLAIIILKAIDKDPRQRYASAKELAEDLRSLLVFRPIRARPTPVAIRGWRLVQRHPVGASLFAIVLLGASIASIWALNRPAWITVTSTVETDVYLDDVYLGRTPLEHLAVDPGRHRVFLPRATPNGEDYNAIHDFRRGESRLVHAPLYSDTGLLVLDSDPPGATVEVVSAEGSVQTVPDKTPTLFHLPSGEYRVRFFKPGFQDVEVDTVVPPAGLSATATASWDTGTLEIQTCQPGIEVEVVSGESLLGGVTLGAHQVIGSHRIRLPPGKYSLAATLFGHHTRRHEHHDSVLVSENRITPRAISVAPIEPILDLPVEYEDVDWAALPSTNMVAWGSDGDSCKELLVPCPTGGLMAIDMNGLATPFGPKSIGQVKAFQLVDLENDDIPEVAVVNSQREFYVLDHSGRKIQKLAYLGGVEWDDDEPWVIECDIDHDGIRELVVDVDRVTTISVIEPFTGSIHRFAGFERSVLAHMGPSKRPTVLLVGEVLCRIEQDMTTTSLIEDEVWSDVFIPTPLDGKAGDELLWISESTDRVVVSGLSAAGALLFSHEVHGEPFFTNWWEAWPPVLRDFSAGSSTALVAAYDDGRNLLAYVSKEGVKYQPVPLREIVSIVPLDLHRHKAPEILVSDWGSFSTSAYFDGNAWTAVDGEFLAMGKGGRSVVLANGTMVSLYTDFQRPDLQYSFSPYQVGLLDVAEGSSEELILFERKRMLILPTTSYELFRVRVDDDVRSSHCRRCGRPIIHAQQDGALVEFDSFGSKAHRVQSEKGRLRIVDARWCSHSVDSVADQWREIGMPFDDASRWELHGAIIGDAGGAAHLFSERRTSEGTFTIVTAGGSLKQVSLPVKSESIELLDVNRDGITDIVGQDSSGEMIAAVGDRNLEYDRRHHVRRRVQGVKRLHELSGQHPEVVGFDRLRLYSMDGVVTPFPSFLTVDPYRFDDGEFELIRLSQLGVASAFLRERELLVCGPDGKVWFRREFVDPSELIVGDLNGDGRFDAVVQDGQSLICIEIERAILDDSISPLRDGALRPIVDMLVASIEGMGEGLGNTPTGIDWSTAAVFEESARALVLRGRDRFLVEAMIKEYPWSPARLVGLIEDVSSQERWGDVGSLIKRLEEFDPSKLKSIASRLVGWMMSADGLKNEALVSVCERAAELAYETSPQDVSWALAWVRHEAGRTKESIRILQGNLDSDPAPHYMLAYYHEMLGHREKAINELWAGVTRVSVSWRKGRELSLLDPVGVNERILALGSAVNSWDADDYEYWLAQWMLAKGERGQAFDTLQSLWCSSLGEWRYLVGMVEADPHASIEILARILEAPCIVGPIRLACYGIAASLLGRCDEAMIAMLTAYEMSAEAHTMRPEILYRVATQSPSQAMPLILQEYERLRVNRDLLGSDVECAEYAGRLGDALHLVELHQEAVDAYTIACDLSEFSLWWHLKGQKLSKGEAE